MLCWEGARSARCSGRFPSILAGSRDPLRAAHAPNDTLITLKITTNRAIAVVAASRRRCATPAPLTLPEVAPPFVRRSSARLEEAVGVPRSRSLIAVSIRGDDARVDEAASRSYGMRSISAW